VEANLHTWLLNSKIASHAYRNLSSEDQAIVNRTLELKAGDDVWLACRPRISKVCSGIFRRDLISNELREDPRLWEELASEYLSSLKLEVGPCFTPSI
jgi:hypothetical protein